MNLLLTLASSYPAACLVVLLIMAFCFVMGCRRAWRHGYDAAMADQAQRFLDTNRSQNSPRL